MEIRGANALVASEAFDRPLTYGSNIVLARAATALFGRNDFDPQMLSCTVTDAQGEAYYHVRTLLSDRQRLTAHHATDAEIERMAPKLHPDDVRDVSEALFRRREAHKSNGRRESGRKV